MKTSAGTSASAKALSTNNPNTPRMLGIVMVVISIIFIVWQALELNRYIEEIRAIPGSMVPDKMFINIYNITNGAEFSLTIISSLLVMLILGIYRVITNKKSKDLIYLSILLAFGVALGGTSQVDSIRNEVERELLVVQKDWAEQRYGISYDEITVSKTKKTRNRTSVIQDSVMKNGEIIATVCKHDNYNIRFCSPGTNAELPVHFADKS